MPERRTSKLVDKKFKNKYTTTYGDMYAFICEFEDGTKVEFSFKDEQGKNAIPGQVITYDYTEPIDIRYPGKGKIVKEGQGGGGGSDAILKAAEIQADATLRAAAFGAAIHLHIASMVKAEDVLARAKKNYETLKLL